MAHPKEQNKLTKLIREKIQTSHLLGKDFRTTFLNILKGIKKNMAKKLKQIDARAK